MGNSKELMKIWLRDYNDVLNCFVTYEVTATENCSNLTMHTKKGSDKYREILKKKNPVTCLLVRQKLITDHSELATS